MSEVAMVPSRAIWIACDHGGFELKQHVKAWLKDHSMPFYDAGCDSVEIVRYPCYAAKIAEAILRGEADRGILICSTGIGMSIIANKYPGIRASLCTSTYLSRMTRAHNDSNVLCLGGKVTGAFEALDILETWIKTPYEGGRHDISLSLINQAEQALASGDVWNPNDPRQVDATAAGPSTIQVSFPTSAVPTSTNNEFTESKT